MVIKSNKGQYPTLLAYLEKEKPGFYKKFRKNYSAKKVAFLEMSEQQYLLWVLQKIDKRTRTKLEKIDDSLIDKEELAELERIIRSSPKLEKIVKSYKEIRQSNYLTKKEKKELDEQAANQVYENIGEGDKKKYNPKRITIIMPKLNLGPYKKPVTLGLGNGDINSFIRETKELFKNREDLLERILERCYYRRLESKQTIAEAMQVLNDLN